MRILLVGEYSNLHNSLKSGLTKQGHEVYILGTGDAFKKLPVDLNVRGRYFQDNLVLNAFRQVVFRITKFDLALLETYWRSRKIIQSLGNFDVIQLINEYPFKTPYFLERKLVSLLRKKTDKLVILACGDDYIYLTNRHKLPHHPMEALRGKHKFPWSEIYLTRKHRTYHQWIFEQKDQLITTDLDYHSIYKEEGLKDYYGMIPNPVNIDRFSNESPGEIAEQIVIFHGINRSNYFKKGNDLFDEALRYIKEKYAEKVEILTAESLPYAEYIQQYRRAHILLDQAYALDQGYNALEAMVQGKVVFTGAGEAFCRYYHLDLNTVAIHTEPNVQQIIQNLDYLINNPEILVKIGQNAREFVLDKHDYRKVAQKYLKAWDACGDY